MPNKCEAQITVMHCPGSLTTVIVQREFTTLGISANADTSFRQRRNRGKPGIHPTLETNNKHITEMHHDGRNNLKSDNRVGPNNEYLQKSDKCVGNFLKEFDYFFSK